MHVFLMKVFYNLTELAQSWAASIIVQLVSWNSHVKCSEIIVTFAYDWGV